MKKHIIVVERYSIEETEFCGGECPVFMYDNDIAVKRYSSEYELYCDIERAVLMTKVRGMETSP